MSRQRIHNVVLRSPSSAPRDSAGLSRLAQVRRQCINNNKSESDGRQSGSESTFMRGDGFRVTSSVGPLPKQGTVKLTDNGLPVFLDSQGSRQKPNQRFGDYTLMWSSSISNNSSTASADQPEAGPVRGSLFAAQGGHGMDVQRPARRDVTGQQSHCRK